LPAGICIDVYLLQQLVLTINLTELFNAEFRISPVAV